MDAFGSEHPQGSTVNVNVLWQSLLFLYVTIVVPEDNPVANPVFVIVATAGFDESQGIVGCAVPNPVNCVVEPIQISDSPSRLGFGKMITGITKSTPVVHATEGVTV